MIDRIAKAQRNNLVKRVDHLQRQIVAAHRLCLDDLVAFAARHLSHQGGRAYMDPHAIRHRLNVLLHHVALLMRPAMANLIAEGIHGARVVLNAGIKHHMKHHRRHTEAEGDSNEPPEGSVDSIFRQNDSGEPTETPAEQPLAGVWSPPGESPDEAGRRLVDQMRLPTLSREEAYSILHSPNPWGNTWEEQLTQSSKRVSDPNAMANALAEGTEEQLSLPKLREKLKPFVEDLSVSAQRIARTEGLRISMKSQQAQYDKADAAGVKIGGMTLHCAMGPHSAEDHKARNGKFYEKTRPGQYVAKDGEVYPNTPYGHPNCMCFGSPEILVDAETRGMIDAIHRRDEEAKIKRQTEGMQEEWSRAAIDASIAARKARAKGKSQPTGRKPATAKSETKRQPPKEEKPTDRAARSKAAYNPSTKEKQTESDRFEASVAKALGAKRSSDNKPLDNFIGDKHGVELKVMHDQKPDGKSPGRVNMRKDSRERKEEWAKGEKGRDVHTVLIDNRDKFQGGAHKEKFSGNHIWYSPGVGAFRMEKMIQVRSYGDLKQLIVGNKAVKKRYGL